jgi:serine/threonine protein kinase
MGYADGGDLSQRIAEMRRSNKSFTEEEALDYFVQICLAMQHVHDRRILHRDLKCQVCPSLSVLSRCRGNVVSLCGGRVSWRVRGAISGWTGG